MSEANDLPPLTDAEWHALVKAGEDEGWKRVWFRVVEPESRSMRSAEMMARYSLTAGDLMGLLYQDMIGRRKIDLYRGEGSFEGWLKRYVRGYVLNADPSKHGELSIDGAPAGTGTADAAPSMDIPYKDNKVLSKDVWISTHACFHDMRLKDPEWAYVHLLKTRFFLSSEEIKDFLDVSSVGNVDQIFSRAVKYMRQAWVRLGFEKQG